MWFRENETPRQFLIIHRKTWVGCRQSKDDCGLASLRELSELDLRRKEDVEGLQTLLAQLDLAELEIEWQELTASA
jgi:hypothetical protein